MKLLPCHYCGKTPAGTIDHVVRFRDKGPTTPENCVPACVPCQHKREMDVKARWNLGEKLSVALRTGGEPK